MLSQAGKPFSIVINDIKPPLVSVNKKFLRNLAMNPEQKAGPLTGPGKGNKKKKYGSTQEATNV